MEAGSSRSKGRVPLVAEAVLAGAELTEAKQSPNKTSQHRGQRQDKDGSRGASSLALSGESGACKFDELEWHWKQMENTYSGLRDHIVKELEGDATSGLVVDYKRATQHQSRRFCEVRPRQANCNALAMSKLQRRVQSTTRAYSREHEVTDKTLDMMNLVVGLETYDVLEFKGTLEWLTPPEASEVPKSVARNAELA